MPRTTPRRSVANEVNVAQRVAMERNERGWSYESLATEMDKAGYPIQASALFKIEKQNPPRRITVDELVGFATVFDLALDELLLPVELVQRNQARELAIELADVVGQIGPLIGRFFGCTLQYLALAAEDTELLEFVENHMDSIVGADNDGNEARPMLVTVGGIEFDYGQVAALTTEYTAKLTVLARAVVAEAYGLELIV